MPQKHSINSCHQCCVSSMLHATRCMERLHAISHQSSIINAIHAVFFVIYMQIYQVCGAAACHQSSITNHQCSMPSTFNHQCHPCCMPSGVCEQLPLIHPLIHPFIHSLIHPLIQVIRCVEQLRAAGYVRLANEVELAKASKFLGNKEFENAIAVFKVGLICQGCALPGVITSFHKLALNGVGLLSFLKRGLHALFFARCFCSIQIVKQGVMHKIWVAPPLPPLFITFFCLCAPCLLLYNLLLLPILAQNALGSLRLQSLCPVFSIHCRAHLHNDAQEFEKKEMRVRARAATNLAFLNMLEAHTGQFDCTVHGLQASWPLFSVFYLLWTTRE